ncbi:MAG: radical SAM protein [Acetatifactor sp.]|nr:radical SAM protein [Acetatifactor sp.]
MKKLLMINEFQTKLVSNTYTEILNFDISNLDSDSLVEALFQSYSYVLENKIEDVVFIARNEVYGDLTELFYTMVTFARGELPFQTYVIPERYLKAIEKENLFIEDIMVKIDISKPRLSEYQVHLNDSCNLNCKGCGHFCPIVSEANFLDLEKYDRDLSQINKKFWGVGKIYLLGGEPLLHPQASKFAVVTRKHFPDADIRLYTNGLLLPKQSKEFWDIIRENAIHIEISVYAPTLSMFDRIEAVLQKNDAWEEAILWKNKQLFYKSKLLQSNGNKEEAFAKCSTKICHYLRDGYLALCPGILLRKIFWEHYNIDPQYIPEDNAINLYDESVTGWQIVEYFKQPNEACYFCGTSQCFDWDTRTMETAQITDWIVEQHL